MKQKIIFIGITMNCAGSEKSFLSFINTLDPDKYDATLLLAKKTGPFLSMLPQNLKIIELEKYGDHFLQSGSNAKSNILNTFIKKNPFSAFKIYPYYRKILTAGDDKDKVASLATKLWIELCRSYLPEIKEKYDIAVAYWGDRTMFYMLDKIKADKYITWMHFDYAHPKRDDSIYLPYFEKCDGIVNVSTAVDDALKTSLPSVSDKCVVIENIQCEALIKKMAEEAAEFPDPEYKGLRILSVARIAHQKGLDLGIRSLKILREKGIDAKWYVIGDGDDDLKARLISLTREYGVENDFIFMGTRSNPYPYIKKCDIFALPSRFEGKPISVEEAKILCKPIVVCDYLSANEQLCSGKYGIVSSFDENELAEKLAFLANKENAGTYIKTLSETSFSNESEIDKFISLIEGNKGEA